ncbi:MAG TPA: polysaccharide pyruvyl transferase family protein [Jatrophihabitans sp.]|nr:polysaccharide pyruvyl transferase family protein [Jatrophihabitans sp.]
MYPGDIVVCSFYTDDDYYRSCAEKLRANLDELGLTHQLELVQKRPDEDWADVCRKKIDFLSRVCQAYPDAKVFWTDVDCQVLDFPEYLRGFTADLIGFQRGFSSPMNIGYAGRTRFWEPCFFGINTTKGARKFIADAAEIEATLRMKATDDYFLEESWRANAPALSFQVIPSAAVVGKGDGEVPAFFVFGSSGNVAEFKTKVIQHQPVRSSGRRRPRRRALNAAKAVERRLTVVSQPTAARLRRWADASGLTERLTRDTRIGSTGFRHRNQIANQIVMAGQRGEIERVRELSARLTGSGIPSAKELGAIQAGEAFAAYAAAAGGESALPLMWWPRPFPGNFGDWLSPLILQRHSGEAVRYVAPTAPAGAAHLVLIGSIGRFVKPRSIVVGTGVSTTDLELTKNAHYVSVRGPLTAEVVRSSGGPDVQSMGDPAALLRRIIPLELGPTNGRLAFVRHYTHANLPVTLPDGADEMGILVSHPDDLESFVRKLAGYDGVITSAMHVMIICHAYGIPCSLIAFRGFESTVHGTGMKYRDYSLGAALDTVWEPQIVPINLGRINWSDHLRTEKISEDKLDEIEAALQAGVEAYRDLAD